jgi:hypothetical protein
VLAGVQQTARELEERCQDLAMRADRCEQQIVEARRRM